MLCHYEIVNNHLLFYYDKNDVLVRNIKKMGTRFLHVHTITYVMLYVLAYNLQIPVTKCGIIHVIILYFYTISVIKYHKYR